MVLRSRAGQTVALQIMYKRALSRYIGGIMQIASLLLQNPDTLTFRAGLAFTPKTIKPKKE